MLAVAVPEVEHARAQFADAAPGKQLGRDERVDDTAEKARSRVWEHHTRAAFRRVYVRRCTGILGLLAAARGGLMS
jgi:hypothetical protein